MPKISNKQKNNDEAGAAVAATEAQGAEMKYEGLSNEDYDSLTAQIETEYQFAWMYMKPRWDEWALRIRLYNNQRRDKDAVGDPLTFTIHQTVLASLYNDKLDVVFSPRESGDIEVAENLNNLAQFDSEAMSKDEIDYEWDWNTLFFGYGLLLFMEFDRELMMPIPEVMDNMATLRDPRAKSVNGDIRGRGRARFIGREIRSTKYDMEESGNYKNLDSLVSDAIDLTSFIDNEERIKDDAGGYSNVTGFKDLVGANQDYRMLEWFTFFKGKDDTKAKLVFVTLGNKRKLITRYKVLDELDMPIIDRRIYPNGTFDGVSIMDLTEDKQRGRATIQNLALKAVKAGVHPMYLFNSTKVKRDQLNIEFNKHIEVTGPTDGAITEIPRANLKQDVEYILNMLDGGAQRATATPDIQQGQVTETKRTLGELQLVNQSVDTRYSLSAKIFGWSEKRFWFQWYKLYQKFFTEGIDEKIIRISGALGPVWRPLTKENISMAKDPDIQIKSKVISDAEQFNRLARYNGFLKTIAGDPNANFRAAEKEMGRLSGMRKDEIDLILPPTAEEIRAREENEILQADGKVEVLPLDDHTIHIEEHNKMPDNPYKFAHIKAHQKALVLQRMRPDLFGNIPPSASRPTAMDTRSVDSNKLQRPETTAPSSPAGQGAQ